MKLKKTLVALSLLASTSAFAGTIDNAALGSSAQQSVDVTFQQPLAVKHTMETFQSNTFKAGVSDSYLPIASGHVEVTSGALGEGKFIAVSPTHPVAGSDDQLDTVNIRGEAIDKNDQTNKFIFCIHSQVHGSMTKKTVQGKDWLVETEDPAKPANYNIVASKGVTIKPGTYNISVDAAIYTE